MTNLVQRISLSIPPRARRVMRDFVVYSGYALLVGWMVWSARVPSGWPVWSWGRPFVFTVMFLNLVLIDLHVVYGVGEKFVGKWEPCQKLSLWVRRRR